METIPFGIVLTIVLSRLLKIILPVVPDKFKPLWGFFEGYVLLSPFLVCCYYSSFGFDLTYWYLIFPLNILGFSLGVSFFCTNYLKVKCGVRKEAVDGMFIVFFIIFVTFSLVDHWLLDDKLNFMLLPLWKP